MLLVCGFPSPSFSVYVDLMFSFLFFLARLSRSRCFACAAFGRCMGSLRFPNSACSAFPEYFVGVNEGVFSLTNFCFSISSFVPSAAANCTGDLRGRCLSSYSFQSYDSFPHGETTVCREWWYTM